MSVCECERVRACVNSKSVACLTCGRTRVAACLAVEHAQLAASLHDFIHFKCSTLLLGVLFASNPLL